MKAWESSYQETGVPGLIKGDMVKKGAVVIDVGKCIPTSGHGNGTSSGAMNCFGAAKDY